MQGEFRQYLDRDSYYGFLLDYKSESMNRIEPIITAIRRSDERPLDDFVRELYPELNDGHSLTDDQKFMKIVLRAAIVFGDQVRRCKDRKEYQHYIDTEGILEYFQKASGYEISIRDRAVSLLHDFLEDKLFTDNLNTMLKNAIANSGIEHKENYLPLIRDIVKGVNILTDKKKYEARAEGNETEFDYRDLVNVIWNKGSISEQSIKLSDRRAQKLEMHNQTDEFYISSAVKDFIVYRKCIDTMKKKDDYDHLQLHLKNSLVLSSLEYGIRPQLRVLANEIGKTETERIDDWVESYKERGGLDGITREDEFGIFNSLLLKELDSDKIDHEHKNKMDELLQDKTLQYKILKSLEQRFEMDLESVEIYPESGLPGNEDKHPFSWKKKHLRKEA
jgi:hypothetical protein